MSDVLAAVLRQPLDWSVLPAATPSRVRRLLVRCLERDARMRLRDIGEARVEVDKTIAGVGDDAAGAQTTQPATSSGPRGRLAWMTGLAAAAVLVAAAIDAAHRAASTRNADACATRNAARNCDAGHVGCGVVGRVPRRAADRVRGVGRRRVASVGAAARQDCRATAGRHRRRESSVLVARQPVDWLLCRQPAEAARSAGGAPQTLAPASAANGGTWSADGVILFAPSNAGPLRRVPAGGGDVVPATTRGDGGRPPVSAVLAGRPAVPVLRHRDGRDRRHLSRRARRHRRHARDHGRHCRGVSANRAWVHRLVRRSGRGGGSVSRRWDSARRSLERRGMAAVWAPGDAGGPALRPRPRRPERRSRDGGGRARHRRQPERGRVFGLGDGPRHLPGRWRRSESQ